MNEDENIFQGPVHTITLRQRNCVKWRFNSLGRNIITQQRQAILDSCLSQIRAAKSHDFKAGVFKFLRIEECFRKAPFSCRIEVDGKPNRRNKAAFWNVWGVGWKKWHKSRPPGSNLCESNYGQLLNCPLHTLYRSIKRVILGTGLSIPLSTVVVHFQTVM